MRQYTPSAHRLGGRRGSDHGRTRRAPSTLSISQCMPPFLSPPWPCVTRVTPICSHPVGESYSIQCDLGESEQKSKVRDDSRRTTFHSHRPLSVWDKVQHRDYRQEKLSQFWFAAKKMFIELKWCLKGYAHDVKHSVSKMWTLRQLLAYEAAVKQQLAQAGVPSHGESGGARRLATSFTTWTSERHVVDHLSDATWAMVQLLGPRSVDQVAAHVLDTLYPVWQQQRFLPHAMAAASAVDGGLSYSQLHTMRRFVGDSLSVGLIIALNLMPGSIAMVALMVLKAPHMLPSTFLRPPYVVRVPSFLWYCSNHDCVQSTFISFSLTERDGLGDMEDRRLHDVALCELWFRLVVWMFVCAVCR